MTPQILYDLTREEYDAIPAKSTSELKRDVERYRGDDKKRRDPHRAFVMGCAFEERMFEGPEAAKRYFVAPDGFRHGTKAHAKMEADNGGRIALKPQEAETLKAMRLALEKNETAMLVLQHPEVKFQVCFVGELFGHPFKCLVDIYIPGVGIYDLKTTSLEERAFWPSAIVKYGYDVQGYSNLALAERCAGEDLSGFDFWWVCQSKIDPYRNWMTHLTGQQFDSGERFIRDWLPVVNKYGPVMDAMLEFDLGSEDLVQLHRQRSEDKIPCLSCGGSGYTEPQEEHQPA